MRYTLYAFLFTLTHYYLTCYILLYFYYHIIIITIIIVIIIIVIIIIISVFCTVRYTLYESATEYGESAYCMRSIWRHHSDKKYSILKFTHL